MIDTWFRKPLAEQPKPTIPLVIRKQRSVALLQEIADRGGVAIADPVTWQQDQRQDRSLPGR